MIYVKVALKDYDDQDIQYTEVPEGTPDSFSVTELPNSAWAVKEPSDACIELVQTRFPGTSVQVFNSIHYLMSPKALLYFPTQDTHKDVALLTFNMPGSQRRDCHFLMVHLKGKHFWHLPWCDRSELFYFLQLTMGLNKPMKRIGLWRVLRQHHKVIDFKTYIYFCLFHTHLTFEEVEFLFGYCGVEGAMNNVAVPQTFRLEANPYFYSLMIVPKAFLPHMPDVFEGTLVDQWHVDAVNIAVKGNKRGGRRLPIQRIRL